MGSESKHLSSIRKDEDLNESDLTLCGWENIFTAISCNHEATQTKLCEREDKRGEADGRKSDGS